MLQRHSAHTDGAHWKVYDLDTRQVRIGRPSHEARECAAVADSRKCCDDHYLIDSRMPWSDNNFRSKESLDEGQKRSNDRQGRDEMQTHE